MRALRKNVGSIFAINSRDKCIAHIHDRNYKYYKNKTTITYYYVIQPEESV